MAKSRVSEAIARPTRTAVQGTPAYLITWLVDSTVWDMNNEQFGVVVLLLTLVISYIQTAVENRRGKGFMRSVPPVTSPIIDDAGPGA